MQAYRAVLPTQLFRPVVSLSNRRFKPHITHPSRAPRIFVALPAHASATIMAASQTSEPPAVAIVTTEGCPYCRRAKAELTAANIPYTEYLLTNQIQVLKEVKAASGQSTVPQVFVGGQLIGGASDVTAGLKDGSFTRRVQESASTPPLPPTIQAALKAALPAKPTKEEQASTNARTENEAELKSFAASVQSAGFGGSPGSTFSATKALRWLQDAKAMAPPAAVKVLASLQAANILTLGPGISFKSDSEGDLSSILSVGKDVTVRWVADCPLATSLSAPLNEHYTWYGPPRSAVQVSADLRQMILGLYDTHMTPDGRKVNYRAMAKDPSFKRYVDSAAELQRVDVSSMNREESMCFWINVYNAMVVHATAAVGPAEGTLGRLKWYESVAYVIDGTAFSLNDVEHGVLRGNAPSPANVLSLVGLGKWAPKTFGKEDPRTRLALTPVDPRIHFALNCGATSCPPIRVYAPGRLELGLEGAAAAFCSSEVQVEAEKGIVRLSSILKWYGADFGSKADLMQFLVANLDEGSSTREELKKLMAKGVDQIKLEYKPYDWTVNAVE